jgi:polyhydroxyalkanoate synthesis regulator phasin
MKVMDMGMSAKNKMFSTGRNLYLAGLGVAATVTDQYGRVYEGFVDKGRSLSEKKESEQVEKQPGLTHKANEIKDKVEQTLQSGITTALGRFGIPSQREFNDLTKSIEVLTEKVQDMAVKGAA